ncbi:hypothetical protein BCA37_22265 [Mycobacterium sp. djl-10]|nr:hypothetical protein BCA37_22265 [Mycobacterium sp. djl-10]
MFDVLPTQITRLRGSGDAAACVDAAVGWGRVCAAAEAQRLSAIAEFRWMKTMMWSPRSVSPSVFLPAGPWGAHSDMSSSTDARKVTAIWTIRSPGLTAAPPTPQI